jgi:hypothetical protein
MIESLLVITGFFYGNIFDIRTYSQVTNTQQFMKTLLFISFGFFALNSFSQVLSGDVVNEGRSLTTNPDFKIKSTNEGVIVYEVAVNREGVITSTFYKADQSTIKSTPLKVEANNYLRALKFESNTRYPQFQHALIKISFVKE